MTSSDQLSGKQVSFGIAGVIFGFLLGYLAAYEIHGTGAPAGQPAAAAAPMGGAPPQPQGTAGGAGGGGAMADHPAQVMQEIEALRQAIAQDPKNFTALVRLGNLYMDASMFDRAVEYYGRALEVDGSSPDVRTDMGACLRELGRPQEALAAFRMSLETDPKHWKSWFNVGVVSLYDLGEYAAAEEAFAKVAELNPGSVDMAAVRDEIERVKSGKATGRPGSNPS